MYNTSRVHIKLHNKPVVDISNENSKRNAMSHYHRETVGLGEYWTVLDYPKHS